MIKLPELGQNPREYHDNLKNVVKFIEESVVRIESLNQKIDGCGMINIGGKRYLNKSEVEQMIKDFAKSSDIKSLETRVTKSVDEKLKPLATKDAVSKEIAKINGGIKNGLDTLSKSIDELKAVKHLTVNDIKEELKPYELTKHVDGKIKSCRDTMGENYENHAKGVDKKVSQITADVETFKESQSLAHEKLKDDTEKNIKSESEKIEKSILKKVLDKISKLMG